MSSEFDIQTLQAENARLKAEVQQLREQGRAEHTTLIQCWQAQINSPDFSRQVLSQILGEVAQQVGAKFCNFYLYDSSRDIYNVASAYPASLETVDEDYIKREQSPYTFDLLQAGEDVIYADTNDIPDPTCREMFKAYKQYSVFAIPIMHEGKLRGFLDLHSGSEPFAASDRAIVLARLAVALIYQGWQELESARFQNWLNENNYRISHTQSLQELEGCLASFCRLIDIDGINLYRFEEQASSPFMENLCSYPSIETLPSVEQKASKEDLAWTIEQLQQGNPLIVDDVNTLPPEAARDREYGLALKQYSAMLIPMQRMGKTVALLDCHTINRHHRWSRYDIRYAQQVVSLFYAMYQQVLLAEASEASRETLKLVLSSTDVGYMVFNRDFSQAFYSDNTAALLGYPSDRRVTPEWMASEVIWEPVSFIEWVKNYSTLFDGSGIFSEIFKSRDAEGKPRWFQCRYQPYTYNPQGEVDTILCGYSDITELFLKQEALEQARIEADSANTSKSEFLARMSHEIRTPMNAIMGMAHLIKDTSLNDKQSDQVRYIDEAAQNLLSIINDILDFSKIEAGKMELENSSFELDSLLEQTWQIASTLTQNKALEIILDLEEGLPNVLVGDSLRLHQILTNLLSNAIKFTEQGNITLGVYQRARSSDSITLEFSVSDQGIGLTQEHIDKLFKPFSQADGSITREYGGTGLGLVIVKRLCELMRGSVDVSSEVNIGSTFRVTVPLGIGSMDTNKKSSSKTFKELHTLIIDDNKQARDTIAHIARSLQLQVETADSAEQGLELLAARQSHPSKRFELVLMDYRMPNMNGLLAAELIKNNSQLKHLPTIIMVSAYDRQEVMSQSINGCVDGFLNKPVSPSRLYNSISDSMGIGEARSKLMGVTQSFELQGLKVLLVEDNIVNQKVAQGLLEKQDVEVSIVGNGQEAIDILLSEQQQFDLVLMDIEMPLVDGYQATTFIRENMKNTLPIIAMTAHAMRGDKEKCLSAGMNDYINKPIDPLVLYKTLAKYKPEDL